MLEESRDRRRLELHGIGSGLGDEFMLRPSVNSCSENCITSDLCICRNTLTERVTKRRVSAEVFKKRDCCSSLTAERGIRCPLPP